jgi:hypothetical protein
MPLYGLTCPHPDVYNPLAVWLAQPRKEDPWVGIVINTEQNTKQDNQQEPGPLKVLEMKGTDKDSLCVETGSLKGHN